MTPDRPFDNCDPCETPVCNELGKCFRALPAEPAKPEDCPSCGARLARNWTRCGQCGFRPTKEPAKPEGETPIMDALARELEDSTVNIETACEHLLDKGREIETQLAQLRAENERMRDGLLNVKRSTSLIVAFEFANRALLPAAPTEPTDKEGGGK